jgi:hypothetical protein
MRSGRVAWLSAEKLRRTDGPSQLLLTIGLASETGEAGCPADVNCSYSLDASAAYMSGGA